MPEQIQGFNSFDDQLNHELWSAVSAQNVEKAEASIMEFLFRKYYNQLPLLGPEESLDSIQRKEVKLLRIGLQMGFPDEPLSYEESLFLQFNLRVLIFKYIDEKRDIRNFDRPTAIHLDTVGPVKPNIDPDELFDRVFDLLSTSDEYAGAFRYYSLEVGQEELRHSLSGVVFMGSLN